jgi:hypothetical protein
MRIGWNRERTHGVEWREWKVKKRVRSVAFCLSYFLGCCWSCAVSCNYSFSLLFSCSMTTTTTTSHVNICLCHCVKVDSNEFDKHHFLIYLSSIFWIWQTPPFSICVHVLKHYLFHIVALFYVCLLKIFIEQNSPTSIKSWMQDIPFSFFG